MGVFANLAQKAGQGLKDTASKPLDVIKGEVAGIASQLDPRNMVASAVSDSGLGLYTSALGNLLPSFGGSATPKPVQESSDDDKEERETNQLLKSLISITSNNVDLTKEILAKNSELVELAHVQKPDSFDQLEKEREQQRRNKQAVAAAKSTTITNNNGSVQSALLGGLTGASIAGGSAAGISAAIATKMGGAIKSAVGIIFKPSNLLKAIGKVAIPVHIAVSLGSGIIGAWDEWQKSGDLSKALLKGLDDSLKTLTFGLIGVEEIQAAYDAFSTFFDEKVIQPIKGFFSDIQWIFSQMTGAINGAIAEIKLWAADRLDEINSATGGVLGLDQKSSELRESARAQMTPEQAAAFDNVQQLGASDVKLINLSKAQQELNSRLEVLNMTAEQTPVSDEEYNRAVNLSINEVARDFGLTATDKSMLAVGRVKVAPIAKPVQETVLPQVKPIYSSPAVIDFRSMNSSSPVIIQQNNDNKSVVNNSSSGNPGIMNQFRHKPVSTSPNLSSKWESEGLLGN